MQRNIFLVLLLMLFCGSSLQQDDVNAESRIVKDILSDYDKGRRPPIVKAKGGPVVVTINMFLRSFKKTDSPEDAEMQVTFRQQWADPRLSYNSSLKYLALRDPTKIWVPDVFFSNSRSGFVHELLQSNVLVRIYPDGNVLYSTRITLVSTCSSEWRLYPFSNIVCSLIIASYGYTTDDMVILWKNTDPVQISKNMPAQMYPMYMKMFQTDYCTSRTNTGEYSCLKSDIFYGLKFGPYFGTLFLPSLLAVLLSCLSFWLDRKSGVSLRLTLLMFCLCTSFVAHMTNLYLSPVSYVVNPTHVWSGCCFLFTLAALLQFYLSTGISYGKPSRLGQATVNNLEAPQPSLLLSESLKPMIKGEEEAKSEKSIEPQMTFTMPFRKLSLTKGNRADKVARALYPSVFLVYNIIYWAVYNE